MAPSGPADSTLVDRGIELLKERFEVDWNAQSLARQGYLAGADERRAKELQAAIDDPDCKAVIAARGGFGITRILGSLNLDALEKRPKWIVGSSDITGILVHLFAKFSLSTIHGPMVSTLDKAGGKDAQELFDLLEGKSWSPPDGLKTVVSGKADGPLIGGNLTMLAHMAGTLQPGFSNGAVLFMEDVGERPYRLDRCLVQLKRAGILDGIAGVVIGELTDCEPGPDGTTVEEALERNLKPLGVPIVAGYPAAHGERNYPFIHGAEATLDAAADAASLSIIDR